MDKGRCDFVLDSDGSGEFCVIPLGGSENLFAKIDPEDFEDLSRYNWRSHRSWTSGPYAIRNTLVEEGGKRRQESMHRRILGLGKGIFADHINGDGLDNRRVNLRAATNGQNQMNRIGRRVKVSKFKGVAWHELAGKWRVSIQYEGKYIWLGLFAKRMVDGIDEGEIEAARAYDEAARRYFGSFARLNFPEERMAAYRMTKEKEKRAVELIKSSRGINLTDTFDLLGTRSVEELEIMCGYFGCNVVSLVGKVCNFGGRTRKEKANGTLCN